MVSGVTFTFHTAQRVLGSNELDIAVARGARRGTTAIRADGTADATIPRPASEVIPPGVRSVAVYFDPADGTGSHAALAGTVTRLASVRRLVTVVDSFPAMQEGGDDACRAGVTELDLRFDGENPRAPLARAVEECLGLRFFVRGHEETPLRATVNLCTVLIKLKAIPACPKD